MDSSENSRSVGIIIKGVGGLYEVRRSGDSADSENIMCRARGIFRHNKITPLPGDMVSFVSGKDAEALADEKTDPSAPSGKHKNGKKSAAALGSADAGAVICEILPRKSALIRPALANLDILFIVVPAASPSPDLFVADELTAIAEYNEIEPVIIVTKCELNPEFAEEIRVSYEKSGFRAFKVGNAAGDSPVGIGELSAFIDSLTSDNPPELYFHHDTGSGVISAFAGISGAGKSTLLNALFPELSLVTGAVSRKLSRGRHTTRTAELFRVGGSDARPHFLADTPGFSMLDFERFDFFSLPDLVHSFRDIEKHLGECRYTKCTHLKEDGCAVIAARDSGELDKRRHESYCKLYAILKQIPEWSKK